MGLTDMSCSPAPALARFQLVIEIREPKRWVLNAAFYALLDKPPRQFFRRHCARPLAVRLSLVTISEYHDAAH